MLPSKFSIIGVNPKLLLFDALEQSIGRLGSLLHLFMDHRKQPAAALNFPLEITAGLFDEADNRGRGMATDFEMVTSHRAHLSGCHVARVPLVQYRPGRWICRNRDPLARKRRRVSYVRM